MTQVQWPPHLDIHDLAWAAHCAIVETALTKGSQACGADYSEAVATALGSVYRQAGGVMPARDKSRANYKAPVPKFLAL